MKTTITTATKLGKRLVRAENGRTAYYFFYEENGEILAEPYGPGHVATSATDSGDYAYTHGGILYRAAVEKCWQLTH